MFSIIRACLRWHPRLSRFGECSPVSAAHGGFAGKCLPTPNDGIDTARIDFIKRGMPLVFSGRNQKGSRPPNGSV